MFGHSYFGRSYFGNSYFGGGIADAEVPVDITKSLSGLSGITISFHRGAKRMNIQGGNKALGDILSAAGTAAANTAAVITITGVTGRRTFVPKIAWSYNGEPTGGRLTITSTGKTTYDIDIIQGGPGEVYPEFFGLAGVNVVITLAAGGSGIVGKLNTSYTLEI